MCVCVCLPHIQSPWLNIIAQVRDYTLYIPITRPSLTSSASPSTSYSFSSLHPPSALIRTSSSFTAYHSPFLILRFSWGSTGVRKGLKHQGKRGDIAFWHASYYFPFNFAAWRGMWDSLPSPCLLSSPHPFSLSLCHNVVQVGRHSGWTDCTIPSNSLIFLFIYGLSSVQQKWKKKWGTRRQRKIIYDTVALHYMAREGQAISFSKINFGSILHRPQLQINVPNIDHFPHTMKRQLYDSEF